MKLRRLGIRDLVTAIVLGCSLGGVLLSLGLAFSFQSFTEKARGLGDSSLAIQDVEGLRDELEAWFPVVEEAVALGGKHEARARLMAGEILLDIRTVASRPVARPFLEEFEALELRVEVVSKGLDIASSLSTEGAERDRVREEIQSGLELLRSSVDRSFDRLSGGFEEHVFRVTDSLDSHRGFLWKITLAGVGAYLALVLGLWRWAIRTIIRPLLRLTAETRHCRSKGTRLRLAPAGPREVRRLTESVSTLVDDLQASQDTLEEKVRERTSELEKANRAKTDFLAKVTHEIRTPMTGILGYAELCRHQDTTDEERGEYLYTISVNAEHLATVINDILDISKIEAGQMSVASTECSPARITSEVVNLMQISAKDKGIELRVEYPDAIPELVLTDPTRLRQVLINLVGNAVKFTEEGHVTLTVTGESTEDGRERLRFDVEDTGVGLSEEEIARIFDPFMQADNSYSRQHGGTGLGLSISRALARLLGGEITCDPVPGGGCHFELTITADAVAGAARVRPEEGRRLGRPIEGSADDSPRLRGRALLAEDVAVNRKLVAIMLERAGLEVDHAENGREAYDLARTALRRGRPYSIVLMDMQMPVMDGYEATRRLRAEGYTGAIVALTAHSLEEDRQRCLEAGCDDYAAKPVKQDALLELVAGFVGGDRRTGRGDRRRAG